MSEPELHHTDGGCQRMSTILSTERFDDITAAWQQAKDAFE